MNKGMKALAVLALVLCAAAVPALAADTALSLVPPNAVTVGVVKFADMRTSPLSSVLFQHTDNFGGNGEAAKFLADAGLDPAKDIDLVVVATIPRTNLGTEADGLVIAEGRFNAAKLGAALATRGAVKKQNYFVMPEGEHKHGREGEGAVAFPSDRLVLMGTETAVVAALAARSNGGTGFPGTSALGELAGRIPANATAWALVDVTRASRLTRTPSMPKGNGNAGETLHAAIRNVSHVGLMATDTGDALQLSGFGMSNDAETLQLLEDTIRGALSAMRLAVKDKQPELVSVLRGFDVARSQDSITVSGAIPAKNIREMLAKKKAAK